MNLIAWRLRRGDRIEHEGVWSQVDSITRRSPLRDLITLTDGRVFTTERYGDVKVADRSSALETMRHYMCR